MMKRVLVLRLGAIGDVVLAAPLLRAIARAKPEFRLEFLVRRKWAPILERNPHLAAIHAVEETGPAAMIRLARTLGRFDLVLDLHGNLASRVFCAFAKAGRVLRAPKDGLRRRLLVQFGANLFRPALGPLRPVRMRYQKVLDPLGIAPDDGAGEVFPDPEKLRRISQEVPQGAIGVAPVAGTRTKRWPAERFREAVRLLQERLKRPVVAFGSPADARLCEETISGLPESRTFLSDDIGATIAGLSRCRLLLCNDTGLMHLAQALSVPVVAVFGPTVEEFGFWPDGDRTAVISRDLPCKPCSLWGGEACFLGHHRCMTSIPAQEVAAAAAAFIQ